MLGRLHRRWTRRAAVVPVALLLWFASLSPIAAQWLTTSIASSCCKHKCCCHRAKHAGTGPAMSASTCASGCAIAPYTPVLAAEFVAPQSVAVSHPTRVADAIANQQPLASPFFAQLYQRPPPANL